MKCPKCDTENPSDSKYCKECATPLPAEEISLPTETLETPKEELTTGSTFARRYQIIEELGKGGMGKVYKVLDKEINSKVALKLIKPEIAADKKTIERFRNELKMARDISHKNICRMYDLGKEEGAYYITMEYVPGEDLKTTIRRVGPLGVGKAIYIAKQVCEGLAEAHRLGVIHRDLKPNNIMIDKDGNARIMDFGIARSLKAKGITGTGVMIGTPEYMSPEQVEGKEADQRSDIYSLGVILYEMVTGRVPFEGDTPLSIAIKHKTETPRNPRELNAQIPEDLSRVILKCMEKDKEKRYQSANDMLFELDKIGESEKEIIKTPEWKNSIAVLPFTNISADPEQEYFCDGMAEEIINALTHIENLKVIARTSAFAFKNKLEDVREIGKKLDVKHLLEGSVRKSGNRLRITAQLIKVDDGSHLWSERYEREMEDIFSVQDKITLAIVNKLKIKLLGGEKEAVIKRYTDNPELYNLYLLGLYHWNKFTVEDLDKSEEYFEQALHKDPDYALAYAGVAEVNFFKPFFVNLPPKKAIPKAKTYLEKALDIDKNLAEAHAILGRISLFYDWNWAVADQEFKRAIELNPNCAIIHLHYSAFLSITGQHEEAILEVKRARELDPLSIFINAIVGERIFHAGQFDKAIEDLQRTIEMDPNYFYSHHLLGCAYLLKSMKNESIAEFEKAFDLSGGAPIVTFCLTNTYYIFGKKTQADKLFNSLKEKAKHEYIPPVFFFSMYKVRGDIDQAFEWFERACEDRDIYLPFCLNWPDDSMRVPDDKRFTGLLKKLGLNKL